jgi:nucleotide-binding universal stress UspA family protein
LVVRYAITAVESTDKPVKIEVEVMQGHPIRTLMEASRSAALMCLGPIGRAHFAPDRVGSTAATLASSALCPVAIVRGRDRPFADRGTILVHVGMAPGDGAVLQAAVDEARLRGLPVQAVTAWQSRFTDIHDRGGVLAGSRDVRARLNRQLAPWARRHPGVFMSSAVVHGSLVDHLAKNAKPIRMMVIGTDDCHAAEIFEPAANAVLHGADCSVLVVRSARL